MGARDMRKGVCAICDGKEIIQAELIEFGARGTSKPMGVAYGGKDGSLGFQPKLEEAFGALNAFVCIGCGHTQLFADNPEKIPLGNKHRTKRVKA